MNTPRKKKFKGTHAGMCNVRWPAEDPFSPLLMFSVFPFCQIVQLSFSCVTPLWCSLWDFFKIFYFVRWMYRNWFQNTFGFICILKLVEKMMLVLMCLFFLLLFIFETKLLKLISPVWSLWRMIYKLVHCEAFYFDWWVGTHAMLLSVVDSCYPTAIKGWWDIVVTQQGNVRVFKLKTLKIFREVFWRC